MFTSFFGNLRRIPDGLTPVAISIGIPRWYKGRAEPRLAPTRLMLKMAREFYDPLFDEILAQLDPRELYQSLGENTVLLCWERPGLWCHRRRVAEFFEEALGIVVPELGFERAACPPYRELPAG
jgi:hypothetical protein